MYLYPGMVFEEWGNKGFLEMHGKGTCRFIMVVIIGRIVEETCFRRKVGIGSMVTLFIRRGMQEFSDFVDRCRSK